MGVGYSVSALHRITYLDTSALRPRPWVRGRNPAIDAMGGAPLGAAISNAPASFRSPNPQDIRAWRGRVARKYREELGEELTWDEGSRFEASDDVATHDDVMLHYLAAVLDQHGPTEVRRLMEIGEPPSEIIEAVFAEAERRGFGGQFPHLLLGANAWLPYKSPLMIEEPDWEGHRNRFGSTLHLLDEVTAVRSTIAEAEPSVLHCSPSESSGSALVAAWQASNTVVRLARIAVARHLPLWATG